MQKNVKLGRILQSCQKKDSYWTVLRTSDKCLGPPLTALDLVFPRFYYIKAILNERLGSYSRKLVTARMGGISWRC